MNKTTSPKDKAMQPEYDLTGKKGVRGKYYEAYRQGHTVKIHQADGAVEVQYFTLADGAVILEADVKPYFPTSESVNQVLRAWIAEKKPALKVAERPDRDFEV